MKFEYYIEIVPVTGEKRVLRFAASGKPIPVPFRRREGEPDWVREIRRIAFHAALEGAQYINANGELVAAAYTQNEIRGRTDEQARASEAFEEERRLKNNHEFITSGTIAIEERDFVAEFGQAQPALEGVSQLQISAVDDKLDAESFKLRVEELAIATAVAKAPLAPTPELTTASTLAAPTATVLSNQSQPSAQPFITQLNLLQLQASASGLASTLVPAVVSVSASFATNDPSVVSKHSH